MLWASFENRDAVALVVVLVIIAFFWCLMEWLDRRD